MSAFKARLIRNYSILFVMGGHLLLSNVAQAQKWINGPSAPVSELIFELPDVEIVELREDFSGAQAPKTFRIQILNESKVSLKYQKKGNIIFFYTDPISTPLRIKLEVSQRQKLKFRSQKLSMRQTQSTSNRWDIVANFVRWTGACNESLGLAAQSQRQRSGEVNIYAPEVQLDLSKCPQTLKVKSARVDFNLRDLNQEVSIETLRATGRTQAVDKIYLSVDVAKIDTKGIFGGDVIFERGSLNLMDHQGVLEVKSDGGKLTLQQHTSLSKVDVTGDSPTLTLKGISDSKIALSSTSGVIQCTEGLNSHWSEALRTCGGMLGEGQNKVTAKLNSGRIRFK